VFGRVGGRTGGIEGRRLDINEFAAAFSTEYEFRRIGEVAPRANPLQLRPTFPAEAHALRILKLALGTFHPVSPQEAGGNAIPEENIPSERGAGRKRQASFA
jgi:hypothetical protein